jgi:hypothetical protein
VIGLDIKYTIYSGQDHCLDPEFVKPHVELESRGRRRHTDTLTIPVSDSENCRPNSSKQESKCSGVLSKTKQRVGPKKGVASKTKPSTPRKIGIPGGRKGAPLIAHSIVSPCGARKVTTSTSKIPREIVFNAAATANTVYNGSSNDTNDFDTCSPLGEHGVESQGVTTSSYDQMIYSQRPSVGTSNAECPVEINYQSNSVPLNLQNSQPEIDTVKQKLIISAIPLATGFIPQDNSLGFEETEPACADTEQSTQIERLQVTRDPQCAPTSLRDVYDHEVKKAAQFIGEFVPGYAKQKNCETKTISIQNDRLNKFRSLLNDFLLDA